MDNQIIKDLLEITKVFMNKGTSFIIDVKIDTDIFKISNQDQQVQEAPKQHWRKTPSQIIRDKERQQKFIDKKKS